MTFKVFQFSFLLRCRVIYCLYLFDFFRIIFFFFFLRLNRQLLFSKSFLLFKNKNSIGAKVSIFFTRIHPNTVKMCSTHSHKHELTGNEFIKELIKCAICLDTFTDPRKFFWINYSADNNHYLMIFSVN